MKSPEVYKSVATHSVYCPEPSDVKQVCNDGDQNNRLKFKNVYKVNRMYLNFKFKNIEIWRSWKVLSNCTINLTFKNNG